MIKHIICHKYNDPAEADIIAPMLRALVGKVPSLRSMEAGRDVVSSARSYHLALIATFDDIDGLNEYIVHPEHVKVKEYIHKVLVSSVSVDFEF